ncbi:hypothetical protein EJ03DRAFT_171224 [Teratosphaeria nubilosa]|uniref:Uncharacterized protein n=1 Tax=Teratosphaeria nubilosa TaxID=161662 RepID=A0A6G1LIQ0_9PEZI|nr:hypothetical protein EJ03DRAFT_171224 [Teratosphaeria nubilosa]
MQMPSGPGPHIESQAPDQVARTLNGMYILSSSRTKSEEGTHEVARLLDSIVVVNRPIQGLLKVSAQPRSPVSIMHIDVDFKGMSEIGSDGTVKPYKCNHYMYKVHAMRDIMSCIPDASSQHALACLLSMSHATYSTSMTLLAEDLFLALGEERLWRRPVWLH